MKTKGVRMVPSFLAGTLLLRASLALAQPQDVPGSKDHPMLSRYPGSFIRDYQHQEFDELELPIGEAKDWNKLGKTERVEGRITKIFYTYPETRSPLEVSRNYEAALSRAGFSILYSCAGMAGPTGCGPIQGHYHNWFGSGSNYDEEKQRTLTAKLSRPEGDIWTSLHVCPQWVFLAVVEAKPMEADLVKVDAAALKADIIASGHVAVYGVYFDAGKSAIKPESEPALQEVSRLLEADPRLKLHVVGHTDSMGEMTDNMELSRARASAVVQALTSRYAVAPARLRADGVGALAPVASNRTEPGRARNRRVELVEQ